MVDAHRVKWASLSETSSERFTFKYWSILQPKHTVENYSHYTCCLNLISVGKWLKKKYAASLSKANCFEYLRLKIKQPERHVDSNSQPFGYKLCTIITWLVSRTMQNVSLSALVLSYQPRVTVTYYSVYNCYVKVNFYTPLDLMWIDSSLLYLSYPADRINTELIFRL